MNNWILKQHLHTMILSILISNQALKNSIEPCVCATRSKNVSKNCVVSELCTSQSDVTDSQLVNKLLASNIAVEGVPKSPSLVEFPVCHDLVNLSNCEVSNITHLACAHG